jgi:hypothetical protein
MKRVIALIGLVVLAGCASEPSTSAPRIGPPDTDPKTGASEYWLDKPSSSSAFSSDYDKLWNLCQEIARERFFDLDQLDYREGVLTTRSVISRQFFEPWRDDCGDSFEVVQSSLQTVRRTIHFEFARMPGGYAVTPKVVVERLAQLTERITSSSEAAKAFQGVEPLSKDPADEAARVALEDSTEHWYAIGRDVELEAELAREIQGRVGE